MFVNTLFITAPNQKQLKYSSAGKRMNIKMNEYYSAIPRNELVVYKA